MLNKLTLKFVLSLLLISSNLLGQNNDMIEKEHSKKVLIDSLKKEIYLDTSKFDKKDLLFTASGRKNRNSYSMLYIVNGAYMYKLDIITPKQVIEFVDEFLDTDKVDVISILPKEKAISVFGSHAQNGVVAIKLKKKAKFNTLVAGLTKTGKNSGDNFTKRDDNEILIR